MDDDALHELTAGYALDALDAGEARAYEQHLAHCPRCQQELATLSESASALAFAAEPAAPPAALRERILDAARAERSNVVPLRRSYASVGVRVLAVAASVAAVGLGIWNVVLHKRLDRSHEALRSVPLHGAAGSVVVGGDGQGTLVVAGLVAASGRQDLRGLGDPGRKGGSRPGSSRAGGSTIVVHLRRTLPSGAIVGVTVEKAGGANQPSAAPFITSAQV